MRTETNHEVGKLINYFENYINDLNKDFPLNSKTNPSPVRTTSQNTTTLAPTNLPTIIDDEDIYDRLTYQTMVLTNSFSSHEQLSVKSVKRRRRVNSHHTTKKRLHRRRPPSYIKELKAYLAHRESSVNDFAKINDIKKFSNVLVWLSNQTTSPSLIETSTPTSLQKIEDSPSITPDSVIATTTQTYSDPIPLFIDDENTHKSSNYLTYVDVTWKLKIRKEVFSPTETFDEPSLIELLYLQIVHDIFSSVDIRISEAERTNMKTFLSSHGVSNLANIDLIKSLSIKKDIIEQARQWSIYFSRLFPITLLSKSDSNEIQILGLSHTGIRLIKRDRMMLQVLETFSFDLIHRVSSIENESTISLYLAKKKKITIHSPRIRKMQEMIHRFLKEFHVLSSSCDLVKSSSQISLMSCSELDSQIPNSTGYSMMEFALQNFQIPSRRQSKKSWKTLEWTWQDYTDLLKWSKIPIQTPLLRQSSSISARNIRQCFLAIMRFMGDYTMARNQTEISCVFYLLKTLHKQRKLIDEILCQLLKQMTENKSMKTNSLERGWKLLTILLNYFIPSKGFQPYFVKYLNDHRNENDKLSVVVKTCLDHYEQTMKYGGRKVLPSKAEIQLLTSTSQNEGKRQVFLLPGGFSITLITTPSMVINDCLRLLCEQLNVSEIDEYSIFIISNSKHSSRLLNPTEYFFDILNEYLRSNITNYHIIIKRILWYHIPFELTNHNQSDMFIDFMYHQLIPELLDGKMIVLNNNHHLSEQSSMKDISLLIALQYRASNKTGLPSMKVIKALLPGSVLKLKNIHSQQWITAIHEQLISSVQSMSIIEAKIKFLNLIQTWPLFGTTLFPVESIHDRSIRSPCLIGINKTGLLFLNFETRETMFTISYNDITSIRRHQMTVDIKHGHLTQIRHLQCQVNRAQEFVALAGRYLKLISRKNKNDTQQILPTFNNSISTVL